jgi:hypothetical protein
VCVICEGLKKNKLTWQEARKSLGSMYEKIKKDHRLEIIKLIWEKQDENLIQKKG